MDKHTFLKLPLIFSLDREVGEHLKEIESEEARLTHLDKLKAERETHLAHTEEARKVVKKVLADEEKELFNMESNLKKAQAAEGAATNQNQLDAATKTIQTLTPRIEESELLILDQLEKIEELDKKIADDQKFLNGFNTTRTDIAAEVQKVSSEKQEEIKRLESSIDQLLSEIPTVDRELVLLSRKKFRFKQPLAKVMNGNCAVCGAMIDRMTQSQLAKFISIELCPGCGRMLMLSES